MTRVIDPEAIKKACLMREAGYSLPSIVEATGINLTSLKRHLKKHGSIKRGAALGKQLESARQELLRSAGFDADIKHRIAASIDEDLILSEKIREEIYSTLCELETAEANPAIRSRSLAALSTALKLTQDSMRRALRIDNDSLVTSTPTEFVISRLTESEVVEIQESLKA